MDTQAAIVGAGVAGCATALHLAQMGHTVMLLDRAAFPRKKVCGEGLMPRGVAELEALGLLEDVKAAGSLPFRGIAYHAGGADAVGEFPGVRSGGHSGLGIRRWRLDEVLVKRCTAHPNITMRLGSKVERIGVSSTQVIIETDDGDVWAPIVVGADGLHSVVRRELDLAARNKGRKRYGVRAHVRLPAGRPDRDVVDVYVGDEAEFYLTPTAPGEANVCLLLDEEVAKRFSGNREGAFYDLISDFGPVRDFLDGAQPITTPKMVGPLRQQTRRLVARRGILVGDAGGFVDGITGEGMSIALVSARLAAEQLHRCIEAESFEVRHLRLYEYKQRRAARAMTALTEWVLWGIRYPSLAGRTVRMLSKHPDTFSRVLAVGEGGGLYSGLKVVDLWRLARGA